MVKYRDLDHALKSILKLLRDYPNACIVFGICDLKSAFRLVPLKRWCWNLLLMKAKDQNGNWKYFIDKCLPFGAAISCIIFQRFLNVLAYLAKALRSSPPNELGLTNYLDDFLHIALCMSYCNQALQHFIDLCSRLGVPISMDKLV